MFSLDSAALKIAYICFQKNGRVWHSFQEQSGESPTEIDSWTSSKKEANGHSEMFRI